MGKQVKVTVRPLYNAQQPTYRRDGVVFSRTEPTMIDEDEITEVMRNDPLLVIHDKEATAKEIAEAEHIPTPSTPAQLPEAIAAEKAEASQEDAARTREDREDGGRLEEDSTVQRLTPAQAIRRAQQAQQAQQAQKRDK